MARTSTWDADTADFPELKIHFVSSGKQSGSNAFGFAEGRCPED